MTTGNREQAGLLGGRYRLLRELGRGGFGCTYLAEDTNRFNELCVLKEFFPQMNDPVSLQKAKQLFEREAGVLHQLNHPQIPKFRELLRVQTGDHGRLFLVQDFVEGPTYQDLLDTRLRSGSRFSEAEITQLFQLLLPVLEYIHSIGVIHRDIAPDNLILRNADNLPVLIDFGGVKQLATQVEQQVSSTLQPTRLGKVGYAPEEQLEQGTVTPSADLYALAVTALVLLTGEAPQALYDRYTQQWRWQSYGSLSPRLAKVLERMLAPQIRDRYPSAAAVMVALDTPSPYPVAAPSISRHPDPTLAVSPAGNGTSFIAPPAIGASPQRPKAPRSAAAGGCWQALLGLGVLVGAIGLVWWIAGRWNPSAPSGVGLSEDAAENAADFSTAEQARKAALRERRDALGIDNRWLVSVTDQLFYERFPDRQGQALSDRPEDASLRAQWDALATEVLDALEQHLSTAARKRLGSYGGGDRDGWRQRVNARYVSSRALFDLADAKFAALFPDAATQAFIDLPIGQIWYGLAEDAVNAVESDDRRQEIQFPRGAYRQSVRDRLAPGDGRIYVLNLSQGQLMRLNLQAPRGATRLSIYVPSPTEQIPDLLSDASDIQWSGQLPQSGYYEIVVVSTSQNPLDYALDVSVDNVTAEPSDPPAQPEDKD